MLKLDDSGLKKYLEELAELVRRAAADGIILNIQNSREDHYPPVDVSALVPELNTSDNVTQSPATYAVQVDAMTVGHMATNRMTLTSHCVMVFDKTRDMPEIYTYAHTPGENHALPESIDYSRYYKQDPNNPINWVNPSVTVKAAKDTGFINTFACCASVDKFCNSDMWRGNLHAVVTGAIEDLIGQNKLKYIGEK